MFLTLADHDASNNATSHFLPYSSTFCGDRIVNRAIVFIGNNSMETLEIKLIVKVVVSDINEGACYLTLAEQNYFWSIKFVLNNRTTFVFDIVGRWSQCLIYYNFNNFFGVMDFVAFVESWDA